MRVPPFTRSILFASACFGMTIASADELVVARDTRRSRLFNPYLVRARSEGSGERPYILIAVAEGVEPPD